MSTDPREAARRIMSGCEDKLDAVAVARALLAGPSLPPVRVIVIDPLQRSGICVGGRLDGWLMRKHPDGQWFSIRRLTEELIVSDA